MEVPLSILAYSLLCIFSYISDLSDSYLVIFNIIFFQFLQFILWIYILVFVWLIVLKGWELIGTSGRRSKAYWMKCTGNVIFRLLTNYGIILLWRIINSYYSPINFSSQAIVWVFRFHIVLDYWERWHLPTNRY